MARHLSVLFATLAAALPGAACAGETNATVSLPSVVVYASRIDATADALPSAVRVFDSAALAHSGARDLPELLAKKANIHVRTLNGNPLGAQIALRGFGENSYGRVKVVLDGEELGGIDMEAPNLMRLPPDGLERVEIISGPSPVLYGDGAVGGVISATTDVRDYARQTRLAVRGGSYGTFGASVRTRGGFAEEGLLYSAAYDYARSDGWRARSAYDTHAFAGGLRQNFENGSTVGFRAHYFNALHEMPGALTWAQWKGDPRQSAYAGDSCRLWQYGFSLDAKAKIAEDQWLRLDGLFSMKHRTSRWGDYGYANDYDLYAFQISPRYVNEKAIGGHESVFTLGADFRYDRYLVEDRSGWGSPDPRFGRDREAAFIREEFFFTEALSLVAGARVETIGNRWARSRDLVETSARDVAGDGELGLAYRPVAGLKTYAKGTVFHRSPFCDELNYTQDGRFLEPERGASLDAGVDYAFAEEFTFTLDGYWMVMDDEIFYNPHAKEYAGGSFAGYNCNSPGRTSRLGFDTALAWLRDKVAEASVRYAFVDARFVRGPYDGADVPLVPESRVRAEAGVWLWDDFEVKFGFTYVSPQTLAGDFDNAHGTLAGYPLFDLGAVYEPSWAAGWKVSFSMDNLFDRDYCDFAGWSDVQGAYYYPACGRSFLLTLAYAF